MLDDKAQMRRDSQTRRARRHRRGGAEDAERLCDHFARVLDHAAIEGAPRDTVISGYWPIRDEIDPRPLLDSLAARGHALALPVVGPPDAPLVFRAWTKGDTLLPGPFGTRTPSAEARELTPRVVIVPLLAFDAAGYRLGYGGGYYDRTLAGLRRGPGAVLAIGVAYPDQRVDAVPRAPYDERLDWVVTETAAHRAA